MNETRPSIHSDPALSFVAEFYSRFLFDETNQALTVLDPSGKLLYQSQSTQHLLGFLAPLRLGVHWRDIVHPDDREEVRQQLDRCASSREHCIFSVRVRSGSSDWQRLAVDAFASSGAGSELRIACIWQRANDLLNLQERLAIAEQKAATLKSAFIGNLSHEIRTPLNLILLHSELLSESIPELSAEARTSLETIATSVTRLSNTIHMLLDLSQIQSGNFRTRPQRIDIHEVINRQLAAIEAPAERKGIKIIYRRDVGEHIIETDEYCLSHALANILDNAMKFTDQGHITLSLLHRIPYSLSITIEDTGRGISEDFLRNIWLPLSQEGADGIRAHRGIGLGLTLTNEYLARINARVGVSSILNRGSIFTIDLDMHPADR